MSYPEVPTGWEVVAQRGFGPFVTDRTFRCPDGSEVVWASRRHRKRPRSSRPSEDTWFAPREIGWWIGTLFAVGSALFAVGAVPGYLERVGVFVDGLTFFVGSIFFTSAGFLQYLEAANAPRRADHERGDQRWRVVTFEPRRIDWWASLIQLVGTLLFNLNTFRAMLSGLAPDITDQKVWEPDAVGSVCFLIASLLCYAEVSGPWLAWRPRSMSWWIGVLNLVGSLFFGISAVAAYVVPETGEYRNAEWVNLGTFAGALCFFVGAVLLLPERTRVDDG